LKGHEGYKELLALSALDADCEERRALEAHLATCADCRAEQRELRDTAAALALAVQPVAPSPQLRSRLLSAIKETPQETRATTPNTTNSSARSSSVAADAVTANVTRGASVASLDEARSKRALVRRSTFAFGALAASLVLVALAAASFVLWQRNSAMKSQLATLSLTLNRTQGELASRNTELERTRRERELLASPDAHTSELAGTHVAESARARLVFDANTGEGVLTATNLPPAPAGKVYQLWFIADGKPLPGSVFSTDTQGRGEMREQIPPAGRRAQIFAVTVEPSSGVQSPTGEIVLKGAA
jgi:anti-sigma-K factor RskA